MSNCSVSMAARPADPSQPATRVPAAPGALAFVRSLSPFPNPQETHPQHTHTHCFLNWTPRFPSTVAWAPGVPQIRSVSAGKRCWGGWGRGGLSSGVLREGISEKGHLCDGKGEGTSTVPGGTGTRAQRPEQEHAPPLEGAAPWVLSLASPLHPCKGFSWMVPGISPGVRGRGRQADSGSKQRLAKA